MAARFWNRVGCAPDDANTSRGFRTYGFPAAASGDLVDVVGHLGEEYQEWLPVGLTFPRIGLIVAFGVLIWTLL